MAQRRKDTDPRQPAAPAPSKGFQPKNVGAFQPKTAGGFKPKTPGAPAPPPSAVAAAAPAQPATPSAAQAEAPKPVPPPPPHNPKNPVEMSALVKELLRSIERIEGQVAISEGRFRALELKFAALKGDDRGKTAAELVVITRQFKRDAGPMATRVMAQLIALIIKLVEVGSGGPPPGAHKAAPKR